jgi:hypothetical protein
LRIKGGKEKSKDDDEEETNLAKVDDKAKEKRKGGENGKDGKKKETQTCNFCGIMGHIETKCWKKDPSQMPEKIREKRDKKKSTEIAGAAVEEGHLLSFANMCDNVSLDTGASICIQVEIQDAYVSTPIMSIDYRFINVTDDKVHPDFKTITECEDEEKVLKWKTGHSSKASLHNKEHEDHNDDVGSPMDIDEDDKIEVDYKFHNDAAFVQTKLGLKEEDVEELKGVSQIRSTLQVLNPPNMWIGDTGAKKHSTKHTHGGINSRPSPSRTRGFYGQAVKPSMEVDIPGKYCNKSGEEQFAVKLQNVDIILESYYNLISIKILMEEGHKVTADKNDGITVQKGGQIIKFDIRVETPKRVLWCAYIKQSEPKSEVAAGMIDNKVGNQTIKCVKKLTPAIKMNIE